MKRIKIFLASSIKEFENERLALKNFNRQMENALIDHGISLRMFVCEYADNAIADGRKQDDFSREIDDCDVFLVLVGKRMGAFTLEEYEYALEAQCRRGDGLPMVLAAFKPYDDADDSTRSFAENLSAKAIRADFNDIVELKAALALTLGERLSSAIHIKVENERIVVAEKVIKM